MLPEELQLALDIAKVEVEQNPKHDLPIKYRKDIYDAMGGYKNPDARFIFGQIAIKCAELVAPLCQNEKHRPLIQELLAKAKEILVNPVTTKELAEFSDLYSRIEKYDDYFIFNPADVDYIAELEVTNTDSECFWSIHSAYEAIFIALGFEDDFEGQNCDENGVPYSYLALFDESEFNIDSVVCAANAFSKLTIKYEYNTEKRKQFWEWWLNETVPQVWELAQQKSQN